MPTSFTLDLLLYKSLPNSSPINLNVRLVLIIFQTFFSEFEQTKIQKMYKHANLKYFVNNYVYSQYYISISVLLTFISCQITFQTRYLKLLQYMYVKYTQ